MRFLVVLFMMLMSLSARSQTIKSLFVAMPDSICPLLTEVNRADFGDFLASGMKAVVRNRFGSSSEMKQMTDDYVELDVTSIDRWQMKLLPVNDSVDVVCLVKTYLLSAHDSSIEFYDVKWNKLNTNDFIDLPVDDDFFKACMTDEQKDSLKVLTSGIGMSLKEMKLNGDNRYLECRYSSCDYLGKEEKKNVVRFLDDSLIFEWMNGKFRQKSRDTR